MANLSDFVDIKSAAQAIDNKVTSAVTNLTSTFQQGLNAAASSVQSAASSLAKIGITLPNSITGGISTIVDKFPASLGLKKPLPAQSTPPATAMASGKDDGLLQYPPDLGAYSVLLYFYEYKRPSANEVAKKKPTKSITLPIPTSLVENFSMKYEEVEAGQLSNLIQDAIAAPSDTLSRMGQTSTGESGAKAILTTVAEKVAGPSGSQTVGAVLNPHVGMIFKGVNIRAPHVFTYRFAPKDSKESLKIKEIIRQLKIRMHPSSGQFTFDYPDLCDITINRPSGAEGQLIRYQPCFLESMSVNYAPNGVPTFFAGTREPTEIELSLTFKEATILTREAFEQPAAKQNSATPSAK